MKHLFFGGVHPADGKELSAHSLPVPAPEPARVVIPMSQHIGVPCTPLVKVGDTVKMGQKIGDAEGGLHVPVHASVSGTVVAVEPRRIPNGERVPCVVIDNDFQDTPDQTMVPHPDPDSLTGPEILTIIEQSGLVGMGGATFPTNIKALAAMGKVDTIIANACECEPYITADDVLLRTDTRRILKGLGLICRVIAPKRAVLAIEDNKKETIEVLKKELGSQSQLELKILPTRYPQGSEKQLVQAVTGRQIPPGGLPSSVGCAVFNVATFLAVYRAAHRGQPVIRRIVTITGEGVRKPCNLLVRIGTPFSELIEAAGGLTDDVWKVVAGGPMMGVAQPDLDVPVVKGTNAILCLSKAQDGETGKQTSCIRCGKCVSVCPMRLQPLYLYRYQGAGDLEALKRLNLTDCMECGSCAYACPAKLPLVERFRAGKQALKEGTKA